MSPRDKALDLLRQALATGVRGTNKAAIQSAMDTLEAPERAGLTDIHYRNLKPGKTLSDPQRPGFVMRANMSGKLWLYRFDHPETHKQTELRLGFYSEVGLSEACKAWEGLRA